MEGVTIKHWANCPARYESHFDGRDPDDLTEDHSLFALPGPAFKGVTSRDRAEGSDDDGSHHGLREEPAFQVLLDVTQFKPEDIMIQVFEGWLLIKGQHGNRMDEHGFVARSFTRQYPLPEGLQAAGLRALLCHDGILVVEAKEQELAMK
ncbi:heat shock protein beta-3 [Clupea harengus]|uniref:Heat shock protein beta-3 n=1 Tax=Clupea harengus TaxID=7950 RepID=A0A6P3VYI0_CLUHA|nr:heat shock protein beta-3 [Clupea harengus]